MMFVFFAGLRRTLAAGLAAFSCAGMGLAQVFGPPVAVPTGNRPVAVYTADVNGDGFADLVAVDGGATPDAATTRVFLSDGKGGFSQTAAVTTAGDSVGVGDFDGDGKPDLAWLTSAAAPAGLVTTLHFAKGNGDGTFGAATTVDVAFPYPQTDSRPLAQEWHFLKAVQVSPGAAMGLVAEDAIYGSCQTFNFGSATHVDGTCGSLQAGLGPVAVADLHRDGLSDLLITSGTVAVAHVFANQPGTHFQPGVAAFEAKDALSVLAHDFDGDGVPDLLAENRVGGLGIFHGYGDGTFAAASEMGTGASDVASGRGGQLVGVADLNGDCKADVVTATPLGLSALLRQPDSMDFALERVYSAAAGSSRFALGDFNGDGLADVAMDGPAGVTVLFGKPGASSCAHAVQLTGTLTASPEPSVYGDPFLLTATLTPAGTTPATGTVTFQVDGVTVATVPVANNTASFSVTGMSYFRGPHAITALYSGDTNYGPLTLTGTHVVSGLRSETDFTVTTPTIYYGQVAGGEGGVEPVDTAVGASVIGGTITFYDGSKALCVLTISSTPQDCPPDVGTGFTVGTHTLYATYSGNDYYDPSTSPMGTVVVLPDPTAGVLVSSLNPSVGGQAVTLTANFTSQFAVPTGTVTFLDGTTAIGTAVLDAGGKASLTTSLLAVGTHSITAVLAPSQNFEGSATAPVVQVVLPPVFPTTTTLSSSANPSLIGQQVTFTATVTTTIAGAAIPAGNVAINIDGATVATVPLATNGTAQYATSSLTLGSHTVIASYAGNAQALASTSATLTQVVNAPLNYAGGGYTLTITPVKLAVPIGSYARATVTVTPIAGFNQTVTLTCADMPYAGTCSFASPALVAGSYTTTLTVFATAPHDCGNNTPYFVASGPGAGLGALAFMGLTLPLWRKRKLLRGIVLVAALSVLPMLSGCGSCTNLGVKPGDYSFTATAKADAGTKTQTVRFTAHL